MRKTTRRLAQGLVILCVGVAAACGGETKDPVDPEALEGIWRYELTRDYLLENGISQQQAKTESGMHTVVLRDGNFSDRWRTADGSTGGCSGKYIVEESEVLFYWKSDCFGDWKMTPELTADTIAWRDIEAMPPYDTGEDQKVSEVFNGVPWTRTTASG